MTARPPTPLRARLVWVEVVKTVALVWIVSNHVAERLFGFPYIANPDAGWPPLAERVTQLRPLAGAGWLDLPLNVLRWVGWTGDQGVQLFLIMSGFGLTWGLLARGTPSLNLATFYTQRARRVYPLWWAVHLLFLPACLALGRGIDPRDGAFYLSLLGLRVTPESVYYFAPSWWYVTLLVQLYAVYPLLWAALCRLGPGWLLVTSAAVAFVARAWGLLVLTDGMDAWARGACFVTRLPEFVFGMSLAAWMHAAPVATDGVLRRPGTRLGALVAYVAGTALSLTLLGNVVSPFLLGIGAFALLYGLATRRDRAGRAAGVWGWVGRHTYAFYLLHHPFIAMLVPHGTDAGATRLVGGVAAALGATVVASLALERAVDAVLARPARALCWAATTAVLLAALGIGSELVLRHVAPVEVLGWGERPSLEPDATFGWRLRPSASTRLRWLSYDYVVTANALGFPGPAYPTERKPGSLRILATGDAFTSAEGVDTDQAWPRLLEKDLAAREPGRIIEVLNFAVTGYGPNQYADVVATFVPRYRPDAIVVGFFVNEYEDAITTNDAFRESIGFDQPDPGRWTQIVLLPTVRDWVKTSVLQPLDARLTGTPTKRGYFLGHFPAFERDRPDLERAREQVTARLRAIADVARQVGAPVVVAMIPAGPQVCGPDGLAYYPRNANLNDRARFDPDRPQRWTEAIARELGLGYVDLRAAFPAGGVCPYQPHNMHWTAAGHAAVAQYLAGVFTNPRDW